MPISTPLVSVPLDALDAAAAQHALAQAGEILRAGGTVAFATETVYGLGANALDPAAVHRIFLAKQRPAWDPLIVHVASMEMLARVARVSPRAQQLMDAFWPGPLTLLLPKQSAIPDIVTAGRPLVGVRLPAHPAARALIAAAGLPIAAPSANRFGHTSPTTAQHVLDDLDGRIDLVLDSGPALCGLESTVIEATEQGIVLYRPGAIPAEQIARVAGPVTLYQAREHAAPESLPSPGVGIRHYAPRAVVLPIDVGSGSEREQQARWLAAVCQHAQPGLGVMLPAGWPMPKYRDGALYEWGAWQDPAELAQRLFAGFRALDAAGAARILCPLPETAGLGAAIEDRIRKAARQK